MNHNLLINIDYADKYGNTALMIAVNYYKISFIPILLQFNADINAIDNKGNTAFLLACSSQSTDIVKLLIENSANIRDKNIDNSTGIIYSIKANNFNTLSYLLDILLIQLKSDELIEYINTIDNNTNNTTIKNLHGNALYYAVDNMSTMMILKLLECKADINMKCEYNITNDTILIYSIKDGNYDIIRFLLDIPSIDVNDTNTEGDTALIKATKINLSNIVELLLKYDVDIDICNNDGEKAMDIAIKKHFSDIIILLTEANSDSKFIMK
jgi:ankyrin repeat protein